MQVSAAGGTPTTVIDAKSNGSFNIFPFFLPDGRHFMYAASNGGSGPDNAQVYLGSLDSSNVTPLPLQATVVQYASGFLWFLRLAHDVSRDGQRIFAVTEKAQAGTEPLTLVVNWPGLLKK